MHRFSRLNAPAVRSGNVGTGWSAEREEGGPAGEALPMPTHPPSPSPSMAGCFVHWSWPQACCEPPMTFKASLPRSFCSPSLAAANCPRPSHRIRADPVRQFKQQKRQSIPPRGPSFSIHSPPLPSFSHPFDEKYTKQIKKARLLRFPSVFTTPAASFPPSHLAPPTLQRPPPCRLAPTTPPATLLRCRSPS